MVNTKSRVRTTIVSALAVAGVVLVPMAAFADADTGWIANNVCMYDKVDGVLVSTYNTTTSVTATEVNSAPGDVGLKIKYNGVISALKWNATSVKQSSTYTVTEFRVYR